MNPRSLFKGEGFQQKIPAHGGGLIFVDVLTCWDVEAKGPAAFCGKILLGKAAEIQLLDSSRLLEEDPVLPKWMVNSLMKDRDSKEWCVVNSSL